MSENGVNDVKAEGIVVRGGEQEMEKRLRVSLDEVWTLSEKRWQTFAGKRGR